MQGSRHNLRARFGGSQSERSKKCIENQLGELKAKNAILVFDATGKLPSGILSGNVNQYGNFDECLSVKNAQYCLAEIDVRPIWTGPFRKFENRVHSYFAFKDEFGDVSP